MATNVAMIEGLVYTSNPANASIVTWTGAPKVMGDEGGGNYRNVSDSRRLNLINLGGSLDLSKITLNTGNTSYTLADNTGKDLTANEGYYAIVNVFSSQSLSITGGAAADHLTSNTSATSSGAYWMDGGAGDDVLRGGVVADTLIGGVGADSLVGATGADSLDGSAGADTLDGGAGADTLTGGAGNDVFVFTVSGGAYSSAGDQVTDLTIGDRLVFDSGKSDGFGDFLLAFNGTNLSTSVRFGDATGTLTLNKLDASWKVTAANNVVTLEVVAANAVTPAAAQEPVPLSTPVTFNIPIAATIGSAAFSPQRGTMQEQVGLTAWTVVGDGTVLGGLSGTQIVGDNGNQFISTGAGVDSVFGGDGADTLVGGRDGDVIGGDRGDDVLIGDGVTLGYTLAFSPEEYLRQNPDVAAAGLDPLVHYVTYGLGEQRAVSNTEGMLFDAQFYLRQNPDVAASGLNPWQHYQLFGWREGRNPSSGFNTTGYLQSNPDVAAANINPLLHFARNGFGEGRTAQIVTLPDQFLFTTGSGNDRILDFRPREDRILLSSNLNGSGITTVEQVLTRITLVGGNSVVDLGGGNSITLVGVLPSDLIVASFQIT
ncbi:MAG: calcium-binding protein [Alphaproteobacteria bacterium]|nr:calcium-binding protein [Alphaproteobacteria bacterium]